MGSFSWTRAEHITRRSNLTDGDSYKILVPKEFGGGYIKDTYFDYGQVFTDKMFFDNINESRCKAEYVDGEGNHYPMSEFVNNPDRGNATTNDQCHCDLYGILAWWNNARINNPNGSCELMYFGDTKPSNMYEILKYGLTWVQDNRCAGINIGCYDDQIDKLKYPLKLVSASYKGTYEDCSGISYGDPNQGFDYYEWSDPDYEKYLRKLEQKEGIDI